MKEQTVSVNLQTQIHCLFIIKDNKLCTGNYSPVVLQEDY